MKKLIYFLSFWMVAVLSNAQANQGAEHQGVIIGVMDFGGKEIVTVEDQTTLITYKSSPITKGELQTGENVRLFCDGDFKRVEVTKEGLKGRVYCHNKDWNKGKDNLLYIPATGQVFVSSDITIQEMGDDTRIVIIPESAIELPESAKSLMNNWSGSSSTEFTAPGTYVKTTHTRHPETGEQVKHIWCSGTGNCIEGKSSQK